MEQQDLFMSEEELRKYKIKKLFANIGIYTFLVLCALFILIPFYWMIATALRSTNELAKTRIGFFPEEFQWSNFKNAIIYAAKGGEGINFLRLYFNTILVGALTTIGTLVTTVLASFAFARLNFKGKDLLFSLFLATMMKFLLFQTIQQFLL